MKFRGRSWADWSWMNWKEACVCLQNVSGIRINLGIIQEEWDAGNMDLMIHQEHVPGDPVNTLMLYNSIWPLPGRVRFWFTLAQTRCGVDRTQQGLQWSFARWLPHTVTEPFMVSVANWVPYKTVWGCSFSNDGAEPPPSPFPRDFVIVAHNTKIAFKEQAGFHFASDDVWMVLSTEVAFSTVKAKLPSLLFESQKKWVYRHKSHRNSYLLHRILSWSTSGKCCRLVKAIFSWKGSVGQKRVIYANVYSTFLAHPAESLIRFTPDGKHVSPSGIYFTTC